MTKSLRGRYADWRSISYSPAIPNLQPTSLLEWLRPPARVLDVGCDTGGVSVYLASLGFEVTGLDLNPHSLALARKRAGELRLHPTFVEGDVLTTTLRGFDAVVAVRFLTCLPDENDRRDAQQALQSALLPGGLLYVDDFLRSDSNPVYARRYAIGEEEGLGAGNFTVPDDSGAVLFIAHHHTPDEVESLRRPYITLSYQTHASRSMRGNVVSMFRFIGRKDGVGNPND